MNVDHSSLVVSWCDVDRQSMHGVYAIDCVIDLSSSDVSEHVKVWCNTLFSRLVARVHIAAPCTLTSR